MYEPNNKYTRFRALNHVLTVLVEDCTGIETDGSSRVHKQSASLNMSYIPPLYLILILYSHLMVGQLESIPATSALYVKVRVRLNPYLRLLYLIGLSFKLTDKRRNTVIRS